jgi:starch synthase
MPRTFEIVFVASEMVPYCKTGGLADVVGALPIQLSRLGANVTAILPYYRSVALWAEQKGRDPEILVDRLPFFLPGYTGEACVRALKEPTGVTVLFIDYPSAYDRAELYTEDGQDYEDNLTRFAVFSKAALEACKALGIRPDIVHAHDWQGSMVPVYLKTHYRSDPFFEQTHSVLTIHNLGYQGRFPSDQFPAVDLPWDYFRPEGLEYFGQVNVLKAGILFADQITTVSPTYAKEIQTNDYGAGLDGVLASRADRLTGILNGVDYSSWDPRHDSHIPARFWVDSLDGKWKCRKELRREVGLPDSRGPLIGMIGRLAEQKGFELVLGAIKDIVLMGCQLVVLGTGEPRYHQALEEATKEYPESVAVRLMFSNPLAHLIEAGSDIFCMPSRYEPCGLNQMYSLRYGTVPVVTATGGLKDTVKAYTPARLEKGQATGFVISKPSARGLASTLRKASNLFRQEPETWRRLMIAGMNEDFGWPSQAKKYMNLYKKTLRKRAALSTA